MYFDKPATCWEETLPLGNGRIGMMIDGAIDMEEVILNDITMWSGSVDLETINPNAKEQLPLIRQLLLEGKNEQAQELVYHYFKCGGKGSNFGNGKDAPYGSFQLLGKLKVKHFYPNKSEVTEYSRKLSLNDAVATTQFKKGKFTYKRQYFASHADDLLVAHYTTDNKGELSMEIMLERPERVKIDVYADEIVMQGQLNDGYDGDKGVRYFFTLKIQKNGGMHSTTDTSLIISNASEVTLLMSTSTNMLDKNYIQTVQDNLSNAEKYSFEQLKKRHIEVYREKFDRVKLDLGVQKLDVSTDQRLLQFQLDDDPSLVALYFQYGRYLMISGTRENSLPLNLQGLWTNQVQTPWNGDYHLNINLQMNYWLAEVGNLAELHLPLVRLTESMQASGEKTAQGFYNADGWVAHMMTNPWYFTAPGEHASWGATNTGGAWLCSHLWEHYQYGLDTNFWARLKDGNRAYSLLKKLLEPAWNPENSEEQRAGTYPNLFCAHPPFQIDGNLGGSAGIAEMLIQSQHGFIELLPALPDKWKNGSIKGVCVRGAGEIDFVWENHQVKEFTLRAKADHQYKIKIPDYVKTVKLNNKKIEGKDTPFLNLNLKKGDEVRVKLIPY